jgi:hypothetical protein
MGNVSFTLLTSPFPVGLSSPAQVVGFPNRDLEGT